MNDIRIEYRFETFDPNRNDSANCPRYVARSDDPHNYYKLARLYHGDKWLVEVEGYGIQELRRKIAAWIRSIR